MKIKIVTTGSGSRLVEIRSGSIADSNQNAIRFEIQTVEAILLDIDDEETELT